MFDKRAPVPSLSQQRKKPRKPPGSRIAECTQTTQHGAETEARRSSRWYEPPLQRCETETFSSLTTLHSWHIRPVSGHWLAEKRYVIGLQRML